MNKLFWMHADCLCAPPSNDAVFVFDDEQLKAAGWGLKRLMFVYECLLELPVEIRRGPTVQTLLETGAELVTVDSPDPWIREQIRQLQLQTTVQVLPPPVFVDLKEPVDLKRFARYWKRAEPKLLA